jgi:pseudaminic acid cytidylyltransferase
VKLCVIPARGGSKRIPRKNIKAFCGKPMIAWSIEAAQESGCFERIVVSTEDDEIAAVARQWGAEAPFMRPAQLADDHTATGAVIAHAIRWFEERGETYDPVCCLYATAPFVLPEDLRKGLELLIAEHAEFAFTVTRFPAPIQRAFRITSANRIEMFWPEYFSARSQDLEAAFHDAGQFYWGRAEAWKAQRPIFGRSSVPLCLPRWRVQDIDTPEDWEQATWMFHAWRRRAVEGGK